MGWVNGHYRRGGYVRGHYRQGGYVSGHTRGNDGGAGAEALILIFVMAFVGVGYAVFLLVRVSAPVAAGAFRSAYAGGTAAVRWGRPRVRNAITETSAAARDVTFEQWVLASGAVTLLFLGGLFASSLLTRSNHGPVAGIVPATTTGPSRQTSVATPTVVSTLPLATHSGHPSPAVRTQTPEPVHSQPETPETPIAVQQAAEECPVPKEASSPNQAAIVSFDPPKPTRPPKGSLTLNPLTLRAVPLARDAEHLAMWENADAKRNDGVKSLMLRNKSVTLANEPYEVAVTIRLTVYQIVEVLSGPLKGKTFVVNPLDLKQW